MSRGYFGVGIERAKTGHNVGTLWRSAQIMGAAFVFTIGPRYKKQPSDTMFASRHVPLRSYESFADFYAHMPHDCRLIGVELDDRAVALSAFSHPERCVYLLGAEDNGLSSEARERCHRLVQLRGDFCFNVAVAGSIVLYDRLRCGLGSMELSRAS